MSEIRNDLQWFAGQMEGKLTENDHKGHWDSSSDEYLLTRLEEELRELKERMSNESAPRESIIRECADVANFAMMIAYNVNNNCRS